MYSIIWFERFGSDLKRMFVNQTISSVCWSMLTWIIFIQIPEMIRYFSKPFSSIFCFSHLLLKNALIVQVFLFFYVSNMVKYLSIFWLKDPFNFQDDFWYLFVNLWVISFSVTSQFVYLYMPGCQPLNYFICTGQYQPPCLSTTPSKINYSTAILQVLSITSHIFVSVRIHLHKRKKQSNAFQHWKKKPDWLCNLDFKHDCNEYFNFLCCLVQQGWAREGQWFSILSDNLWLSHDCPIAYYLLNQLHVLHKTTQIEKNNL